MSRSKHTEAQMIAAVKQMEAGRKAEDVAREVGVSAHTIYAWKSKYGGMDVSNDSGLRERLVALAREKPRFGYRRLHVLLGREGEQVNHKRVHRIYRQAGLGATP